MSTNTHSAYELHTEHILIWVRGSICVFICRVCLVFFFFCYEGKCKLLYTLFYTAVGSCHNQCSLCAFTFCRCTLWVCVYMLRSVVVSACMRACVHVCCMCAEEPLWNTNRLAAVSVTDLRISETADGEREHCRFTHIQYTYIRTGCESKNKKQVLFTRWTMVALPTLDENHVWLRLITAKSFHMAAVCSESVMFLNINT